MIYKLSDGRRWRTNQQKRKCLNGTVFHFPVEILVANTVSMYSRTRGIFWSLSVKPQHLISWGQKLIKWGHPCIEHGKGRAVASSCWTTAAADCIFLATSRWYVACGLALSKKRSAQLARITCPASRSVTTGNRIIKVRLVKLFCPETKFFIHQL